MLHISSTSEQSAMPIALRLTAGLALSLFLTACSSADRLATNTVTVANDYHEQHPIALTNQPQDLDVFPDGNRLNDETKARIKQFARDYNQLGQGTIVILAPMAAHDHGAIQLIRSELSRYAVHTASIRIGSYQPQNPYLASPIRLSFERMSAHVAHPCGEWPHDIAGSHWPENQQNQAYYNFGCSNQAALAAQIADPRDLANPRAETPADTNMRTRAFDAVREGRDPGTDWRLTNTNIGTVGAGQ